MRVRAVLFDLGNTLLEYAAPAPWREVLPKLLERIVPVVQERCGEVGMDPAEFGVRVAEVVSGEKARGLEHRGQAWHFAERLQEGLGEVGLTADEETLEALTDAFYEPIRAVTRPYADTTESLERIGGLGAAMGIITNSPWDTPERTVRGDVEKWGLEGFFGAFVCSGEVPWRKPSPEFMWAAAEELRVSPEDCLVVGDRLERDIAGAQAAGMRSVWVNREGLAAPGDGPEPDWVLENLAGVVEITAAD
jgi:HAD superfamily hydrolase (TIGR01549 family)